ncbi:MAG: SusC/RagA family TonB-linked outer membrane protein [Bacteroidetes bacterium]|nr:SusC/RagA family TonB-linked outer membrane protein [Bacteroidota bacterium]
MKKSLFLLFLGVMFMSAQVMAQMSVSGTVTDDGGESLIGVNIVEKGTTNGTVTDLDGKYSLQVGNDATLVFSYVGFEPEELLVTSSTLDVTMRESGLLDEVVVSALAIERNSREVVYANQTLKAEDLTSSQNTGALNALQGKLAGVKISSSSGNVGSSTRIVLRGETSITGNNNALIVVDGIPVDNSAQQGGAGSETDGFVDFGNRGNDINPDDIASITVLKGPSATSLYGSRGAAGVVLITTKKGSNDNKFRVGINTTTTFEKAYVQLDRQDKFGVGYETCKCDPNDIYTGENFSWGGELDGVVRPWTSPVLIDTDGDGTGDEYQFLSKPYSAVDDQLESFFNTGRTTVTNVNFAGGSDNYTFYASYSNADQESIVPGSFYKKNGFNFRGTAKFSEKLKSDFGISYNYINQKGSVEGNTFSGALPNGYFYAVQTAVDIPFTELRNYNSPFHGLDGYYGSYTINPYFILGESSLTNKVNNLLGNFGLTFTPIEGLDVSAKLGANMISSLAEEKLPQFAYNPHEVWIDDFEFVTYGDVEGSERESHPGAYSRTSRNNLNLDFTGQISYEKYFGTAGDYSIRAVAGYNFFQRATERTTGSTRGGLVIPGFYALDNSVTTAVSEDNVTKYRIMGAYGNATFGWRNMLFAEYSARNDWSSTLPEGNRAYFYNAGGVSFIASELIPKNNGLSFLKARASIGTSGKDAPTYRLESTFIGQTTIIDYGNDQDYIDSPQPTFTQSNRIGNPDLQPEISLTYEAGVDISLYKNHFNLEYTYYNTSISDQIIDVSLANSSGYTVAAKNIGEISNKGHELSAKINPLPSSVKDVKVDLFFNFSKNKSEVTKVSDESDELILQNFAGFGTSGIVSIAAIEGMPYGVFKALDFQRDPNGNIIVSDINGQPLLTDEQSAFGSYQPDFITSFGTSLSWKGLSANILFDVKKGGVYYSYTKALSEFNGSAASTVINDREDFIVEGSVNEIENPDGSFTYEENTVPVTAYDYITNLPGMSNLVDASYIKLRELGVSYTLPSEFFKDTPLSSVSVGFIAKNLKFWLADENAYADPEVNGVGGTGNGVGVESHATPTSRSYGFRVALNF